MRQTLLAVMSLIALTRAMHAEYLTGNDLYRECFLENGSGNAFCWAYSTAYIHGLFQGQRNAQSGAFLCIPQNITADQITLMVQKELRDHPELLNEPADSVILDAFGEHYSCKPGQTPTYGSHTN